MAQIQRVELNGAEVCVKDLGGQNVAIKNLGDGTIYASAFPGVTADADNVIEIPAGGGEVLLDARGKVYLLGSGRAQCTGTDYAAPNFRQPSPSSGGGGVSDVTKGYVDSQDTANLAAAKAYTDEKLVSKADKSEIPTALPADGGDSDTVNGHTVESDVPANAKFTDTKYTAATTAPKANGTAAVGTSEKYAREDHVHPSQTSVSGNAGTADKLKTARNINGVAFDGTKDITITAEANGGNSGTVNGHTVGKDVPADAQFTDTVVDISGKMDKNNPTGTGSFSIGRKVNSDIGEGSIACGQTCTASGDKSQAFGLRCEATGDRACAIGEESKAQGHSSTAQGYQCTVDDSLGYGSHASGHGAVASGITSYAEGFNATANGDYSCAIGYQASALGESAFALGSHCTSNGDASHTRNLYCTANAKSACSQGYATQASHHSSFAAGNRTMTGHDAETVIGFLNEVKNNSLLTIGYGQSSANINMADCPSTQTYAEYGREGATLANVFRVDLTGSTHAKGEYSTSGADYAEFIKPWFDDNESGEDRRGYLVTVKDGKLYKAEPNDYIVGITSGNPSVIGNNDDDWIGRWKRDEFNGFVYQDVEVDDYNEVHNQNGTVTTVKVGSHIEQHKIENPNTTVRNIILTAKTVPNGVAWEWSEFCRCATTERVKRAASRNAARAALPQKPTIGSATKRFSLLSVSTTTLSAWK